MVEVVVEATTKAEEEAVVEREEAGDAILRESTTTKLEAAEEQASHLQKSGRILMNVMGTTNNHSQAYRTYSNPSAGCLVRGTWSELDTSGRDSV